ncbi:hypothetical protein ACKVEX_03420 [Rhodocyclaceae bacterium SMB388]
MSRFDRILRRTLVFAPFVLWFAGTSLVHGNEDPMFPDIVSVQVRASGADTFDFDVTVSSSYDTPARYADGFRVVAESGEVLGERTLWHDHQYEQPFTRDLYSVTIPRDVTHVVVQGRDQKAGYGGASVRVRLPGR